MDKPPRFKKKIRFVGHRGDVYKKILRSEIISYNYFRKEIATNKKWIFTWLFISFVIPFSIIANAHATTIETVDSNGDVGEYTSLALDSSGKAHISYYDGTNGNLKYVTNASGEWVKTTIDSTGNVGQYTSIALDSSGKVHISYYDSTNGDLKYATNATGSWQTTTVDSSGDVGQYSSIAIDSSVKVHISYYDGSNTDLKYATNVSGSWVTETIDDGYQNQWSSANAGQYSSIAIDRLDKVHISYYSYDSYGSIDGTLKYATNSTAPWTTTVVHNYNTYDNLGQYTSIAVDKSGSVHISYYDSGNSDLKYATNITGSWQTTTVDSRGYVGKYTSIALDSSDKVHISYYYSSNGDLKYATNASGSLVTTTIDSTGNVGQYTSIALDSSDKVHISYYDYTNDNLKYATVGVQTECEDAEAIEAGPTTLTLQKNESSTVIITVTGRDGCPVEGDTVKAKSSDNTLIRVFPRNQITNANGQTAFAIKAKNKTGVATVTFKDGSLSTQVTVTVTK